MKQMPSGPVELRSSADAGLHPRHRRISDDTVSRLRPLARRRLMIFRPFLSAILARKPCLLRRFLLLGWNVRFIYSLLAVLLIIHTTQRTKVIYSARNARPIRYPIQLNSGTTDSFQLKFNFSFKRLDIRLAVVLNIHAADFGVCTTC